MKYKVWWIADLQEIRCGEVNQVDLDPELYYGSRKEAVEAAIRLVSENLLRLSTRLSALLKELDGL